MILVLVWVLVLEVAVAVAALLVPSSNGVGTFGNGEDSGSE